jgi:hypothetical protein
MGRVEYLGELLDALQFNEQPEAITQRVSEIVDAPGSAPPPAAPATATPPPAPEGRDKATGRFTTGNKAARGNPFFRRMAALRSALLDEISEAKLRKLVSSLYYRALHCSDTAAAALLLKYAIGTPGPAADPDRAGLDEWQLLDACPTRAEIIRAVMDSIPPELAADYVLGFLPGDADTVRETVVKLGELGLRGVLFLQAHRNKDPKGPMSPSRLPDR